MDSLNPIYTEKRECQDCYKCLRNCPVKAIKVEGGCASVIPELCIFCGQCVGVCPSGAKRVRDDLPAAERLLTAKSEVVVSLAPSYVCEFPGIRPGQLIRALKRLGFSAVSETALGAQHVSAQAAAMLRAQPDRVLLSSACPTVVCLLQRHQPGALSQMTGLLSPLLAHCKLLRQNLGPHLGIVFIGPCIAKKLEATQHPELLDVVLTFADLRRWLTREGIDPAALQEEASDRFVPEPAAEGAWYPIDGGMIAGMKSTCAVNDGSCMAFSGIGPIEKALAGVGDFRPSNGLFLELLACEGGCVNGPSMTQRNGTAVKRHTVLRHARPPEVVLPRATRLPIDSDYPPVPPSTAGVSEAQLREALRLVGKHSADDELNCGGCGYDSCRAFAAALVNRKAERSMCVTHMRKLALNKAQALIQKMPAAVVIVNDALRILEHNAAFTRLCATPAQEPREGALLSEFLPFANLFHRVLKTGDDLTDRDLRFHDTILNASIFTIEKHAVVGAILQDITKPAVRKEQVIRRAEEVIQKNLATVQKIAFLLGENAAESEITLNSIIDSFSPRHAEEPVAEHDWRKLYRR